MGLTVEQQVSTAKAVAKKAVEVVAKSEETLAYLSPPKQEVEMSSQVSSSKEREKFGGCRLDCGGGLLCSPFLLSTQSTPSHHMPPVHQNGDFRRFRDMAFDIFGSG